MNNRYKLDLPPKVVTELERMVRESPTPTTIALLARQAFSEFINKQKTAKE